MYINIDVGNERSTRSRLDPHSLDPRPRRNRKNRRTGNFYSSFGSESGKNTRILCEHPDLDPYTKYKDFVTIEYFLMPNEKNLNKYFNE